MDYVPTAPPTCYTFTADVTNTTRPCYTSFPFGQTTTATDTATYCWPFGGGLNQGLGGLGGYGGVPRQQAPLPTNEELQQLAAQQQIEAQRRVQERHAREARAAELLEACLSAEQLVEWKRNQRLTIPGPSGRRYMIGQYGAVIELGKNGQKIRSFCIHPVDNTLPTPDIVLAMKLLLEGNEPYFLTTANATPPLTPPDLQQAA